MSTFGEDATRDQRFSRPIRADREAVAEHVRLYGARCFDGESPHRVAPSDLVVRGRQVLCASCAGGPQ